jgi:hypothetical protein
MRQLMTTILGLAVAVTLAGSASASSITLAFVGGGGNTVTASASDVLAVNVYANFAGDGFIEIAATSVNFGANLAGTGCAQRVTQVIGTVGNVANWERLITNCTGTASAPAMLQNTTSGTSSSSGTLIMGTITFHVNGSGVINSFFRVTDGFFEVGSSSPIAVSHDSLSVNVIPEPTTVALLATGMLGLLGFSRRWKG